MRIPRLLRTASFRLAATYALMFGVSVAVLGVAVLWITRSALERVMKARIEAEVTALQAEFDAGGLDRLLAVVRERERVPRALDYRVEAGDGHRLEGNLPSPRGRVGWIHLAAGDSTRVDQDREDQRIHALAVRLRGGPLVLVGDDLGYIEDANEAILRAFVWALGLTVILGIIGGLVVSAAFLRRIDAITRTAQAIVDGDVGQRVPERGTDDDLDRLARTLNHMLERIGELMESMRQVSSDIAHELRTPLTRLRQRLGVARSGSRSAAELEAAIDGAVQETDSVLDTFSALLRIAHIESGTRRAAFADVDLSAVVEAITDAFAPAAEDEGKTLVATTSPETRVRGDRELLIQMLANLVENAIRHTPSGTQIEVGVALTTFGVRVVVADNGPGIPPEERDSVFRRFQRLERSRGLPGSGLGLSLVRAIVELHGARIALEDHGPGLRVTVDFGRDERPARG